MHKLWPSCGASTVSLVCICSGIASVIWLPSLPSARQMIALGAIALSCLLAARLRCVGWALSGFLWVVWVAAAAVPAPLDPLIKGEIVTTTGTVVGMVRDQDGLIQFLFDVHEAHINHYRVVLPTRMRVSCYRCTERFAPGEKWRLELRVKPLRRYANRASYDTKRAALRRGFGATAYIVSGFAPHRVAQTNAYRLNALRHHINGVIEQLVGENRESALILALATGTRYRVDKDDRRVLMRTGTAHLMAISGLHIGLAAGLGYFLGAKCWRKSRTLRRRLTKPAVVSVCGLLFAVGYALLSGLAVSTQRALLMLIIFGLLQLSQRRSSPLRTLLLALTAILVIDPLASLDQGLWMSFAAVMVIVGVVSRLPQRVDVPTPQRLYSVGAWMKIQLALWLLLAPFAISLSGELSLWAPVANAVAVPVVSLLVVPLVLVGAATIAVGLSVIADPVLQLAASVLGMLWPILAWMANAPGTALLAMVPLALIIAVCCGLILMSLPLAFGVRSPGVLITACLLFWVKQSWFGLPVAGLTLTVLDVGQGLAAIVRSGRRVLIFDTGRSFTTGGSMAEIVIAPWLRAHGIDAVDVLVISHSDDDHAGGARYLRQHFQPQRVFSSFPLVELPTTAGARSAQHRSVLCHQQPPLRWGPVTLEWLAAVEAPGGGTFDGNNASCVLLIRSPWGRVMMTGDIEAQRESALLARYVNAKQLNPSDVFPVDVLMIPHHGSQSSSSLPFVLAANPLVGLISTASGNRYGHPHASVITRYRLNGIATFDTANSGEITVRLSDAGIDVLEYRRQFRRFWHQRPPAPSGPSSIRR